MKTFFLSIIIALTAISCSSRFDLQKPQIIGNWAFVEKTDSDYLYVEVYISNDSIRFFYDYNLWSFSYDLVDNSIRYEDKNLEVEVVNDYTLNLKRDYLDAKAFRILPANELNSPECWDTFYLRRIHFFVSMGYENISEAKDIFCNEDLEWHENIQEEEIEIRRN